MQQISKRLFNWASIIEPKTQAQAELTATMPFIHPHVALMPDCHLGKGATVGSVIPTLGAVIPAAVGVDIGCGMMALRTRFTEAEVQQRGNLQQLHTAISAVVPLSAGKYNERPWSEHTDRLIDDLERRAAESDVDPARYAQNWRLQLGSLGSGNHFIEVTADETGRVWLFLHSGSRGVGNKMAQHHIRVAQQLNRAWWIQLPDPDLAYLVEGTDEFWAYIRDLRWAQHFALLNRVEMMDRVKRVFAQHLRTDDLGLGDEVNCHHNYTEQETHWGRTVWLSRKGAISAKKGERGLIPGSMGTASYVVEGLGNKVALNSAPHGAGREYSRSAARKAFTRAHLDTAMAGITWGNSDAFLDEIPGAYKDVDVVMADAADLVRPVHVLHQLVNVKGD
jgi:tRNA-splicing ligase RtcB (3'-phosphate/5'-hydroxy nucleic acid ligase)